MLVLTNASHDILLPFGVTRILVAPVPQCQCFQGAARKTSAGHFERKMKKSALIAYH
jgi:hypothetical protein